MEVGCVRKHYTDAPWYHFIFVIHRMLKDEMILGGTKEIVYIE